MITRRELQFTNPNYFNDPFDSHPGLLDHEVPDGYSRGWMPKSFIRDKSITDSINIRRKAWISCLSKRRDNILMWSYYTNHMGVCIGLNSDIMSKYLGRGYLGNSSISNVEVQYKDILEKPSGIVGGDEYPYYYQLRTKGTQWSHEEEVRYIINDPYPGIPYRMNRPTNKNETIDWTEVRFYPPLSKECFDSIYLGARISEKDKYRILQAVNSSIPDVKVFQMVPDSTRFSFVEEPVDIELYLIEHRESELEQFWNKVKRRFPFTIKITYNRTRTITRHFRL